MKVPTVLLITLLFTIGLRANAHSPPYGQRTGPIGIEEVAPDFTLQDHNGQKVTLSDARGRSPVVLVFYRGYW